MVEKPSFTSLSNFNRALEDLVRKMSEPEKIAQLCAVRAIELTEDGKFSPAKANLLKNGIGIITRLTGDGLTPDQARDLVVQAQNYLIKETRLGIPAIVQEECLAGIKSAGAASFPQSIALAATWDTDLLAEVSAVVGEHARSLGVRHCLSPVLDLALDPRWGRVEETYGEDPYLVASLGIAYVSSLQSKGVIATGKHFAGHGGSEGGRNAAPVNVSERYLRENHLFPFEAVIKEANLLSVMAAYHQLDGVPCHANRWLLDDILRKEWGFSGIVLSDGGGVPRLKDVDGIAADCAEAAIKALRAGVDVEIPSSRCYPLLNQALASGIIEQSLLDASVRRVLAEKFALGLFEDPISGVEKDLDLNSKKARELALKAAEESVVLLKNDGTLPLKKGIHIALIGPNAANARDLFGDYHYTAHLGLKEPAVPTLSILESLRKRADVIYAKGCDIASVSKEGFSEAFQAANRADVIVVVLGDRSGLHFWGPRGNGYEEFQHTVGEGVDLHDLRLPGVQEELLNELIKVKKPLILILINGRPYATDFSRASAALEAWLPGQEGGEAIAEILFGEVNPSGHLPISLPKSVGQLPVYYYRSRPSFGEYVFSDSTPYYPFGHGLSYSNFQYSSLETKVKAGTSVEISFCIENRGPMEGKEVAQLYVSKPVASVGRPIKQLRAFTRVGLRRGEKKRVTFVIPAELLAFYDNEMRLIIEKGEYEVGVGSSSEDIKLTGSISLTNSIEIGERRVFRAKAYISEACRTRA
ncbi:MAG: glycoside hydrolase family 3 N-terminal domain-containing protein [Thermoprotei archaeon]